MPTQTVHVGVDATTWWNDRGFGRFTRALVTALAARSNGFRYTLLVDQPPAGEFPAGVELLHVETKRSLVESAVGRTSRSVGDLWRISRAARRADVDMWFFPAVYSYVPVLTRTPCVVCFHDVIAEQFPGMVFPSWVNHRLWQFKTAVARLQARRAMTISQASARDLQQVLKIRPDRIDVVTEAADPCFRVIDDPTVSLEARRRHDIPLDATLLVYVGGMNPHKNLTGLLAGMIDVVARRSDVHLAVAGDLSGTGFWDDVPGVRRFIRENSPLDKHVHLLDYVDDGELVALLNGAVALVFPSLLEGFGLPAVEAMACGVPVLASRRGSLPEVVDDAGMFFDPEDPSSISNCLLGFLTDPALRPRLAARALQRAEAFSWERAAELAELCFERCIHGGSR